MANRSKVSPQSQIRNEIFSESLTMTNLKPKKTKFGRRKFQKGVSSAKNQGRGGSSSASCNENIYGVGAGVALGYPPALDQTFRVAPRSGAAFKAQVNQLSFGTFGIKVVKTSRAASGRLLSTTAEHRQPRGGGASPMLLSYPFQPSPPLLGYPPAPKKGFPNPDRVCSKTKAELLGGWKDELVRAKDAHLCFGSTGGRNPPDLASPPDLKDPQNLPMIFAESEPESLSRTGNRTGRSNPSQSRTEAYVTLQEKQAAGTGERTHTPALKQKSLAPMPNPSKEGTIRVTSEELQALHQEISRRMKALVPGGGYQIWRRIFPDIGVSKKPAEVKMGKSKGSVEYWSAHVFPGTLLFEISGVSEEKAVSVIRFLEKKTRFCLRLQKADAV
jgi:large subunit ribosomal protein L16